MGLRDRMYEAGGRLEPTGGPPVAVDYGDARAEWLAVRSGAGLLVRAARGVIVATGTDTLAWLQGMLTGDLRSLRAGGPGLLTLLTDATGHCIADVRVVATAEGAVLDIPREEAAALLDLLDGYLISEDVALEDRSGALVCLSVQGPAAEAGSLRAVAGARAVCAEADHTGVGGLDLYVEQGDIDGTWDALVAWGAAPVGETAAETLRVEAGLPRWGVDFGAGTLAPEVGLPEDAISYTKGCYVGQEVVARIRSRGHTNRGLAGVVFEPDVPVSPPASLLSPEGTSREAGRVTSVVRSYALDRHIGLATVRHERSAPGTALTVTGSAASAVVTALPFARARP